MRKTTTTAALAIAATITTALTPTALAAGPKAEAGDRIHLGDHLIADHRCTLGPIVNPGLAATASHCGRDGDNVRNDAGQIIGKRGPQYPGIDVAPVYLQDGVQTTVTPISNTPLRPGDQIAHDGATSGWTPGGKVLATGEQRTLADPGVGVITGFADAFGSSGLVDMVPWEAVGSSGPMTAEVSKVEICSRPGDSGAPVWRDGEVVGVLSAASPQTARTECAGERVSFVADITGGRLG